MNPKRKNELIKGYALESGEDEELVSKVIKAYYGQVQKYMTRCQDVAIRVPKLGMFYVLDYRLEKKITRLENTVSNLDETKSLRNYSVVNDLKNQLITLKALNEQVTAEKERKKEIKRKRYEKD